MQNGAKRIKRELTVSRKITHAFTLNLAIHVQKPIPNTLAKVLNYSFTELFVVALFTMANDQKQIQCPSIGHW